MSPIASGSETAGGRRDRVIRVLLVDDHRILRQGIVSLLEEEPDIDVVGEAADGEAAIEAAISLRPDVIVMDITMPRMSGIEATRRILADLPAVRIVGLSMHSEKDMAAAIRDAGAAAFITKGGPSEQLIAAIRGQHPPHDDATRQDAAADREPPPDAPPGAPRGDRSTHGSRGGSAGSGHA